MSSVAHTLIPDRMAGLSSRVRIKVVVFLCAVSFLTYYDRQCIVRAQEDIQRSLGLDDDQIGLIFGAFWLAYALFEIPGGWMGDRIGARFTITRIVLAWSIFTALTGVATGFYALLIYRFLFGVGEAGAYPNMARIQSRWLPIAERARAGGLLWLSARWGMAFAPLIFGALTRGIEALQTNITHSPALAWITTATPWRLAFVISGAFGIIWCLAFYPWFRDEPVDMKSVSTAERLYIERGRGTLESSHRMDGRMWLNLISSPSLWAIAMYYFCGSFGWSFFASWMPKYMKEVQGVTFEKSEWSSALPLLCGGVACVIGGALSDALAKRSGRLRLSRAIFPVGGCLIAALSMLAIPYATTPHAATILMCVAAAAFDLGQAANWASIIDIGGRNAGVAMGFINTIGNLAHASQPYIGSRVFHTFGWNTLFGVYATAFLAAMATWAVINPTRTFYDAKGSLPGAPATT